jgi:hypothetical protein
MTEQEIAEKSREIASLVDDRLETAAPAPERQSYKDFLLVCWYLSRNGTTRCAAISTAADDVWHKHLALGHMKYASDCRSIFDGHYLDHVETAQDPGARDRTKVESAYQDLRLNPPEELRAKCVWAVLG